MPLVDYASSGEESEGEPEVETKEEDTKPVIKIERKPEKIVESATVKSTQDEDDNSDLFQKLPKPRKEFAFLGDDNSLSKLLLNTSNLPLGKKTDKKSIKIAAPSVSEFEDGEQPRKKLKPSAKGVGLFSILPPPKNNTIKESNRTLIPQILAKSRNKKNELIKSKTNVNTGVEEDDDIQIGSSFFGSSLTESSSKEPELPEPTPYINIENTVIQNGQKSSAENPAESQNQPEITSDIPIAHPSNSSYELNTKPQGPETSIQESLDLDEAALQILCGNKKKRQQMPVNIIDLSGEEIMPDSKEWLLKQFTEEKRGSGLGHKKSHGFSSQSRRKHQITYLAYQAKEQELELQNMWAQNRMSRKQTQQKYGF